MLRQHIDERQKLDRQHAADLETANGELTLEVQKRRTLEAKLTKLNRALTAHSKVQRAVFRAGAENELMEDVCRIMVETGGYTMVWAGLAGQDKEKAVLPVAQYGFEKGYLDLARIRWDDTRLGRGPTGTATKTGTPCFVQDIRNDPNFEPWRDNAIKRGYASCVALPLLADSNAFGALTLYSAEAFSIDSEEIELLNELAKDLAFGIISLRNKEKRTLAELSLRQRVEELKVVNRLAAAARAKHSTDQFFESASDILFSCLNPDFIILYLLQGHELVLKGHRSRDQEFEHRSPEKKAIGECLCALAATGKPSYSVDIDSDPLCTIQACKNAGVQSFAALPLRIGNDVMGVLGLASSEERDFSRQSTFLQTLADQMALGLEAIRTHEQIEHQVEKLRKTIGQVNLAREEIRKSKELLRAVFDGFSDPLIMVDKDMKVRIINEAAGKYYRVSSEEAVGGICNEVFWGRSEPCEGCTLQDALTGGEPLRFRRAGFEDPDRLEHVDIFPCSDGYGEQGAIIHVRDITEQVRNENQLILADKLISLGVLVSGVAHEINNPNNFIMLNAPIVIDAWKSIQPIIENYYHENGDFVMGGLNYSEMRVELPGLLSGIVEGSRRIKRIVQDLKAYARHDNAGTTQNVDIKNVIEGSVRLLNNLIRKSTEHFSVEVDENLPLILGNAQKVEQVVINLIQNACQGLTKKEQRVSVKSWYHKEKNGVVIEVTDEGVGIPEETMPHIMDPFFTTKRGYGGTGLGLSVCSTIVKTHQGTIDVVSREGKGSVFRVFLPVHAKREPLRILVVDDDDILRKSMVGILESNEDYLVQEASNGAVAFLLMGHHLPDLLILDIHMPDMDGVEVCRLLKEREELSKIEVIVVTGLADSPRGKKIADMGFKNIIRKPFKPMNFLDTVRTTLEPVYSEGIKHGQ